MKKRRVSFDYQRKSILYDYKYVSLSYIIVKESWFSCDYERKMHSYDYNSLIIKSPTAICITLTGIYYNDKYSIPL